MKNSEKPNARVLADFDRTIFDTALFVDWLWKAIESRFSVNGYLEKLRAKEFYSYTGDWYDYQFFAHIEAIPAISVGREEFIDVIHTIDDKPDFLFKDAAGTLKMYDEIITFGNRPYQEFKISFCPEIGDMPKAIIQESKSAYIMSHYEEPLVLIDDKHLEDELPEWVLFILLDRSQAEPILRRRKNFVSVNSLEQVQLILADVA